LQWLYDDDDGPVLIVNEHKQTNLTPSKSPQFAQAHRIILFYAKISQSTILWHCFGVGIPLIGLTLAHFCAFPKPAPGFQRPMSYCFVFSEFS